MKVIKCNRCVCRTLLDPYTVDQLGQDVLDILNLLEIESVHFCGLSLGGMIGIWLGANAPDRVRSLTICCTSAYLPPVEFWNSRINQVVENGMESIDAEVKGLLFSPAFIESDLATVEAIGRQLLSTSSVGYNGCCAAIRDMDLQDFLKEFPNSSLVIAGVDDLATPPDHGRLIAQEIPNYDYVEFKNCVHFPNIEQADVFNKTLSKFLGKQKGTFLDS